MQERRRCLKLENLESRQLLAANPVITEFMANNNSVLLDGSNPRQYEDWVELYNSGDASLDLAGWHLTDNAGLPAKWTFPSKMLAAGEFLTVFVSGNDAPDAAGNLHTNFRLDANGEYIALVRPDLSVASEFSADGEDYPPQRANVSYGSTQQINVTELVGFDSTGKLLVQSSNGGLGTSWTGGAPFNDSAWMNITTGVGFKPLSTPPAGSTTAVLNPLDGHYLQTVATGMTWTNARNNAQTLTLGGVAGHLATIRSAAENAAVLARGSGWIGAHDQTTEGNWEWVDAPATAFCVGNGSCSPQNGAYTNWNGGEPNDVNGEDYAQLIAGSGLWNDLPNTSSLPSIVEFDTTPSGAFTVRQVNSAGGGFSDIDAALSLLAGGPHAGETTGQYAAIDFGDPQSQGTGHYASTIPYPLNTAADDNNFVIRATGTVEIPTAGNWTFGILHDDNARLTIRGGAGFQVIRDSLGCCGDDLFTINIPTPGFYELDLIQLENGGTAHVELYAAAGSHTSFNTNLKLIGDVRNGGLALSTFGNLITTDVGAAMRNVNASALVRVPFDIADPAAFNSLSLRMAYDDGFVAYLNGVEVARRNAPASVSWNSTALSSRTDAQVGVLETINLTPHLGQLHAGENVLAIQGLNFAAGDADFLIYPELQASTVVAGPGRFFSQPTPGAFNSSAGVVDFVEDVTFSVEHGFYDQPFTLVMSTSTPGAQIRYTTDGKLPTATTGLVYGGSFVVGSTSVIRAAAFRTDFQSSRVSTNSYFFLSDVVTQSPTGAAPAGWPASWGANVVNYGMDPDVVGPNDIFNNLYENTIKDDLKAIPTWSIVMNLDDLFSGSGIYANPSGEGKAWERAASFEVIDPTGQEEGFQSNGGIRIRGGFSRSTGNPKHSFRLFFREEYGQGKLDYPLFGDEGASEFDAVDLRTSQNYSWAFQGDSRNIMNRDVWSRDTQREMGQPYTRSRYYHLYINGQYWGLYQTQERSEADYAASYLGGTPEDYDIVKAENYSVTTATDGTLNAAAAFYDLVHTQFNPANAATRHNLFMRMQGLNPDGTLNPAYPKYLDVDNLIDYMLIIFYTGNWDAPITSGGGGVNNFFGAYNRNNPDGFKWFAHDAEHTLLETGADRTGPFGNISSFTLFNPQYIFQQLTAVPEFRLHVADRVHQHYFNGGVFTTQSGIDRFNARRAEIDRAIVGESARWGDAQRPTSPFTRADWLGAVNNTINNFFNPRSAIAFNQMVNDGLYSTVETPEFLVDGQRQHGGTATSGAELGIILGTSSQQYNDTILVQPSASVRYFVPTTNGLDGTWFQESFNNFAGWLNGTYGIGYDTNPDFDPHIATDVQSLMLNQRTSIYMRTEFTLTGSEDFDRLLLRMKYEDGFVAYLNGQKVADGNAPVSLSFQSVAAGNRDEGAAVNFQDFDISQHMGLLHAGTNVLAIHGLNVTTGSSDALFVPELRGGELIPGGTSKPVYFTTDGSDPRLAGGGTSPTATVYQNPIALGGSVVIKARTLDNGNWSPLTEATFTIQAPIRVTELNYHPAPPSAGPYTAEDFEFLEIQNVGDSARSLAGLQFIDGVQFDLTSSSISTLNPGERAVLVKNLAAFQARYGAGRPVAGVYTGSLANEGEQITLIDTLGTVVQTFSYDDEWYPATDGNGFSLAIVDAASDVDTWNLAASWRVSD
ncbi:MAG: lamin tail domain-containing protein, partial [Pirellulales bacterium]